MIVSAPAGRMDVVQVAEPDVRGTAAQSVVPPSANATVPPSGGTFGLATVASSVTGLPDVLADGDAVTVVVVRAGVIVCEAEPVDGL